MSNLPIVTFTFNGKIRNNKNFKHFLSTWESLYELKIKFILVFDTTNMSIPNVKYCFKMTKFIKKIRKKNPQYLQKSYIIVKNNIILNMLNFIFLIQPPVAPVHIGKDSMESIIEHLKNNTSYRINIDSSIDAGLPFLPFL
tara:strand:- start:222 stop:644 length:423 start_codon:yes stop_codon:yes gene_type:complete